MAISFNVPNSPHTSYLTTIENETFRFVFRWSTRAEVWHLDIFASDGTSLTRGAKLVPDTPLLTTIDTRAPEGWLVVINNTSNQDVPSRENIGVGKDFELMYFTLEELESAN
jgi:hypothetical protein